MKKIFLLLGVFTTFFSCSAIDEMLEKFSGDYVESVEMTVEDFEDDNATTRTALSNLTDAGAKFAWAENDTVGIFPNVGDQVSFSMAAGAGTSSATFNGGGWALRTSSTYSAYYPFSKWNIFRNSKSIAINMVGQTQNGNDDTSEIGAFDIMAAAPASAETGNVKFAFKHQVSICRIKLTLPASKSYKSVKVIAPNKKFITEAKLDISVATPTITATKTSEEISLSLRNFSTTSTNKELVANMYVLPVDMSADKLTVEVTDVDGNAYKDVNVTGVSFEKAKIRILNATPVTSGVDGEGEGEDFTGDEKEIEQPLTFTALEDNSTIALANYGGNAPNVEYSLDGVNWTTWDYSAITLAKNQKVYMRGDNSNGFSSSYNSTYSKYRMTGKIAASGNIMSLLYPTGFETKTSTPVLGNCFCNLFEGCTSLTSAPALPATTLTSYCYYSMFKGCTSLTSAPALPATTLAYCCYYCMFWGCTGLTSAPVLPAVTLADYCYFFMFKGCTSLTKAPELPATYLAYMCCSSMFEDCTSLTAVPELPATTLAPYCYDCMFKGCTSLTSAPALPATNLESGCYFSMFKGCTSLTKAPELPATYLEDSCYQQMFYGCTSLTAAPELPATTLAPYCYDFMFDDCTSLTTAPELPATILAEGCYRYMFYDCTSLKTVKMAATNISASNCTYYWLSGVSSTGTFYKNKNAAWNVSGSSGIPSGWTIIEYEP